MDHWTFPPIPWKDFPPPPTVTATYGQVFLLAAPELCVMQDRWSCSAGIQTCLHPWLPRPQHPFYCVCACVCGECDAITPEVLPAVWLKNLFSLVSHAHSHHPRLSYYKEWLIWYLITNSVWKINIFWWSDKIHRGKFQIPKENCTEEHKPQTLWWHVTTFYRKE